ncbi:hypothetical protein RRG08_010522 [Elysia crispata]|uniref:Uncharacterized protein n=1 Tax=Elysia crispata TaxID=231223 RepID=A0AAE1ANK1_9GAST|nr:hypothetical protein RRG08_010522 [Elysia crispata]
MYGRRRGRATLFKHRDGFSIEPGKMKMWATMRQCSHSAPKQTKWAGWGPSGKMIAYPEEKLQEEPGA